MFSFFFSDVNMSKFGFKFLDQEGSQQHARMQKLSRISVRSGFKALNLEVMDRFVLFDHD